jgi:DNA invertase Pin-like site-specific DNA recombinase
MEGNGMAVYGYIRCSPLKQDKPPQTQTREIERKAVELGGNLAGVFIEPVSPGNNTAILARPAGKQLLEALQAGDTLLVARLDRLGYSIRDVQNTLKTLYDRGIRVYLLNALNGEFDLSGTAGRVTLHLFALQTKTERALRSERLTESAQRRKLNGLAYGGVPTARRIVQRKGGKALEWDREQLQYIAEIAERVPKEGAAKVAKDFWNRGIKDRRGQPWGKQIPRSKPKVLAALEMLVRRRPPHRTPYAQFYRAVQWFNDMKRKGTLPPPYGTPEESIQKPQPERGAA